MAVIIKGMEMPKSCKNCFLEFVDWRDWRYKMFECAVLAKGDTHEVRESGRREDCPLEEAPEQKKGRWIPDKEYSPGTAWYCSECGERTTSAFMYEPRYNYCPMCGAKMEGMDETV